MRKKTFGDCWRLIFYWLEESSQQHQSTEGKFLFAVNCEITSCLLRNQSLIVFMTMKTFYLLKV